MFSSKGVSLVVGIVLVCTAQFGETVSVTQAEWDEYKLNFSKSYTSTAVENVARYYYAYNKYYIDSHNYYYQKGTYTYTLKATSFSDMRLIEFNALFPKVTQPTTSYDVTAPTVVPSTATALNLITDFGFDIQVEEQGTVCNSGWAYATAKAIELLKAEHIGVVTRLSAQQLIDCAGTSRGCTNQVPQSALDYLTLYTQNLNSAENYPNNNSSSEQGTCTPSTTPTSTTYVTKYARILDNYDTILKQYVSAGYPVVVEIDPTSFQFMHYASGVFQQPTTSGGSHFMVVVGFNTDATTNLDYWILLNSFGTQWGVDGYLHILMDTAKSITKSAIFPSELN